MDVSMKLADRRMDLGEGDGTSSGADRQRALMFRYAILLAFWLLIAIVAGASLTSELQPQPGPGVPQVSPSTAIEVSLNEIHVIASVVTVVLILGLAVWFQMAAHAVPLRKLAWAAVAIVAAGGVFGIRGVLESLPRGAGFLHALLAQLLLSLVAAIAVEIYRIPGKYPVLADSGRPSLRSLAPVMPALALLQVVLGASYRHDLSGVMWHILNALVVGIVVLCVSMMVIRQYAEHRLMQPAALALAIITGVQIFLGFATFIMMLIVSGGSAALTILSVAHVTTGALTLAGTVVLMIEIRTNLYPQSALKSCAS
jgi:heme A synthase